MEITTLYKAEKYNNFFKKMLENIYNDFVSKAIKDYKFELTPISFEKFIKSVDLGLLDCIVLFENNIISGFLVYTTVISEAIELNIIHCINSKDLNKKFRILIEKFIEINKLLIKTKIVTYPMLGRQSEFIKDIYDYGFKTLETSVMSFNVSNLSKAKEKLTEIKVEELPENFTITNWKYTYKKDVADVIHQAFKDSSDVLYDNRFTTYKGCYDIIDKIIENTYGEFLPAITKVLLYKKHPIGFCFLNLTNDKIANIPILAILKKYRGNGYSKIMLKHLISNLLNYAEIKQPSLSELNVSCDSNNKSALNSYLSAGFSIDYTYPIAYHSGLA